jgi:hypothetical protein
MRITVVLTLLAVLLAPQLARGQAYCKIGESKWISGCEASCTDSWEGGNCPQSCTATPPPGFVIVDHRSIDKGNNNGGFNVSRVAAAQKFSYKRNVEQAYKTALNLAGKANKKSVQGAIKQDMSSAIKEAESFDSTHQLVRLSVNASKHGSIIDKKRGWSHREVQIEVRCVTPKNLEQQLYKKYGLK